MATSESISKEALLRAIGEIPTENLSIEAIADKVARLLNVQNSNVQTPKQPAKSLVEVRRLFKNYVSGKRNPPNRKPVDAETYRQNLLKISVWSEDDVKVFDENRKHFNK
ncbi:MAG: hypothetical protein H7246_05495 [Phycisphaerae bacterium]|nr:hypothetical protein [Saprospiraceae bacterium]